MAYSFQVDNAGTLTTSLVAYWKLDEATGTRTDVWGGHDLTLGTEPGSTTGKIGSAADFTSASSEFLTAGNDSAFNITDFSVSFWINTSTTAGSAIFSKYGTAPWWIISIGDETNGKIYLDSYDGTNERYVKSTTEVNNSTWRHVIVTRTGGTVNFYIDGGAAEQNNIVSGTPAGALGDSNNVLMGKHGTGAPLNGAIDEFGFWTKVLSAQERSDLYNGGNGQTMTQPTTSSHNFGTLGIGS